MHECQVGRTHEIILPLYSQLIIPLLCVVLNVMNARVTEGSGEISE